MTTIYRQGESGPVLLDATGPRGALELLTFAGGEPHLNVHRPQEVTGFRFVICAGIGSFAALGEVLVASDALRRSGAVEVSFICPYLPGARQDRGAPLTAKIYADIINAAGFERVVCVDPHSAVMPALLERLLIVNAEDVIDAEFLSGEHVVLVCPDAGATKRTEAVAQRFGLEVVYARKHRNPMTGQLDGFSCEPVPAGATAVVVDDICDGGGTFLGLATAIGLPRERMRLWTTHGIYAKGVDHLRERYARIGCTDSFPAVHKPDVILPLTSRLLSLV